MTVQSTAPLLVAEHLSKSYAKGYQAVDDLSLQVAPGEILGVVGESGSGKTTTGKMLLGLTKPDAGSILFEGRDLRSLPRREVRSQRARLQFVPQNPQASLNPRLTVGSSIQFNLRAHRLGDGSRDRGRLVDELLDRVGLPRQYAHRYPHELSGGQLQRVAIARALSTNPALVVCDEPVSALDKSVQAQVLNLLADLQRMSGVAFVFISHDLAVVEHICDNVIVMHRGKAVERGEAARVWASPQHPYTATLLAATPGRSLMAR